MKNTDALAQLARRFQDDPTRQLAVWDRIGAFRQEIQQEVIRNLSPDLANLDSLVDRAAEGELGYRVVKNCPYDCSVIPETMKARVAEMIKQAPTS